ncbi:MAG: PIN domain-containing protein [Armatimonadetes bacterium]|nr:PIN domain-containing protein [Armatimonadota bacterium]MBS1701874.1 PIN domain-containing protein [Armatimonadota bacterium]MBS1728289.1 PIN domain-containing protein [Armatimonadota bacterium]
MEKPQPQIKSQKTKSVLQVAIPAVFAIFTATLCGAYGPQVVDDFAKRLNDEYQPPNSIIVTTVPLVVGGIMLGWFLGSLLIRSTERFGRRWDRTDDSEKVTWFVGGVTGFLAATFFITLFSQFNIQKPIVALLVFGLAILFSVLTIFGLHSMKESLPWYRGKVRGKRTGIKILDTNVIIDGRVYDVARAGFIEGNVYVPKFVLEELQYIADSHDGLRRQRGRRGLEILKLMQSEFEVEVGTHDQLALDEGDGVDARLVRLALAVGGDLVTNDHNLNRVATLQEVRVLNINDLALSLRPNVLPQEHLEILVHREGNQSGQGVGYLEDGTMVIIENGRRHIGETIDVMVTQVIQTERGKLIFAEVPGEDEPPRRPGVRRHHT